MYLREVGNLLNAIAVPPNGYLVVFPDFIQELVCGSGDRRTEGLVQRLVSAAIFKQKTNGNGGMLHINARILLANAVLEDCEIVAADIRNEVAPRVLYEQFDSHDVSVGIEINLRFLTALFALE